MKNKDMLAKQARQDALVKEIMGAGHTPGPWTYDKDSKDLMSKAGEVCSFNFTEAGDNDASNVALIAAAPEMLEALESILEFLLTKEADGMKLNYQIIEVENAIKKAKGEE